MAHYGSLGDHRFGNDVDDIRGATVYGSDEQKIGTVDDVILDHTTMEIVYIVVNSGDMEARKFMMPADKISYDEKHPDDFKAGLTKEQSKSVPPHDGKALKSESKWNKYLEDFKRWWEESPLLHRKDRVDRIITPPEEPGSGSAVPLSSADSPQRTGIPAAELFPERMTDKFSDPRPGSHKITMRPKPVARVEEAAQGASLLRPRWDTFEEYLSLHRSEIVGDCNECGREAEGERNIA